MSSDIKLQDDFIILEGRWTRLRTWDLMLDAADRRANPAGWRRALVHNHGDKLTINYNGDYPGGVEVLGDLAVEKAQCNGELECKDLFTTKKMMVTEAADFAQASFQQSIQTPDVTITPPAVQMPVFDEHGHVIGTVPAAPAPYSLLGKIAALEAEIDELKNKVAALEAGNP